MRIKNEEVPILVQIGLLTMLAVVLAIMSR
jgi:hypothetical protein